MISVAIPSPYISFSNPAPSSFTVRSNGQGFFCPDRASPAALAVMDAVCASDELVRAVVSDGKLHVARSRSGWERTDGECGSVAFRAPSEDVVHMEVPLPVPEIVSPELASRYVIRELLLREVFES